jgi:hypothetical protein
MLTLLTCRDCANGEVLRLHLGDALDVLGWRPMYAIVDVAALPPTDPRRGYPRPTVLWNGRDLFGLAEAPAPYQPPT